MQHLLGAVYKYHKIRKVFKLFFRLLEIELVSKVVEEREKNVVRPSLYCQKTI